MHGLLKLAVLALASTAMASHHFRVRFERFSEPGCQAGHKIHKDTHLRGGHCKTFDKHEPPFESFRTSVEKGAKAHQECKAIVYEDKDCHGESLSVEGVLFFRHSRDSSYADKAFFAGIQESSMCVSNKDIMTGLKFRPRSVKIECKPRKEENIIVASPVSQKATTLTPVPKPTTTITVWPKPSQDCGHCGFCGGSGCCC